MIVSIGLAFVMIRNQYQDMKEYDITIEVQQIMLNYSTMVGVVIAIFTSLFLGVEYSDGAIRNKISVGHKRLHIYLSNLIVTTAASLFSYIIFIAVAAAIGIPLFGPVTMPLSKLLALLGCIFVTVTAYCGLFTLFAMVISNKAVTAIVSIMVAFGLMMAALTCFSVVQAPKYIESASVTNEETGEFELIQEPNPKYPSEAKRKVYQTLLDINPSGQMFQLAGRSEPDLKILPIWSSGLLIIFTAAGIILFDKKDIK